MKDFNFLSDIFDDWIGSKIGIAFQDSDNHYDLGYSEEEFLERFVNPYVDTSTKELEIILKEQTRLAFEKYDVLMKVKVVPRINNDLFDKIEWVISNIKELNLEGFELKGLAYGFNRNPYKQCHYCGKLVNSYKNVEFNERLKFCHKDDCDTNYSNPEAHNEDCCFRKWKHIKKIKRQKYKRILNNPKYSDTFKVEKIKVDFEQFCEERFEYYENNFKNKVREKSDFIMTEEMGITDYEKW